jgi:hypothetical protein
MWIWTRGQERWNSSPNMIEMKVAKEWIYKVSYANPSKNAN